MNEIENVVTTPHQNIINYASKEISIISNDILLSYSHLPDDNKTKIQMCDWRDALIEFTELVKNNKVVSDEILSRLSNGIKFSLNNEIRRWYPDVDDNSEYANAWRQEYKDINKYRVGSNYVEGYPYLVRFVKMTHNILNLKIENKINKIV